MKDMIEFKSYPFFFSKEKSGVKNNTVRECDDFNDERFKHLFDFSIGKKEELTIVIRNSVTGKGFMRKVRDVTIHGNQYIITWGHEDE
jgi:hypothetical protein